MDWQRGLRRQFGRKQAFGLENLTQRAVLLRVRVMQIGAQLISAPASTSDPKAAHPWIERDPATGARSLNLPPPDTARRVADALSAFADGPRGTG